MHWLVDILIWALPVMVAIIIACDARLGRAEATRGAAPARPASGERRVLDIDLSDRTLGDGDAALPIAPDRTPADRDACDREPVDPDVDELDAEARRQKARLPLN